MYHLSNDDADSIILKLENALAELHDARSVKPKAALEVDCVEYAANHPQSFAKLFIATCGADVFEDFIDDLDKELKNEIPSVYKTG